MSDETTTNASAGVSESDFAEAAASPSSFSVEGLSQTNRSLTELVAADKYLRARSRASARRRPLSGVGFSFVVPPGP